MNGAFTTRAGLHTAGFYAAMFGALGALLPFWPVWLEDWGLSPAEVGLYTSLGVAVRALAGLAFPVIADRLDQRRLTVFVLSLLGAVVYAAHVLIEDRAMLLIATLLTGAAISGIMPLGEALGTGAAKARGFPYAHPRAIGSVAFLVANIIVGVMIARTGADAALWWAVALLIATALLGLRHPGGGTLKGVKPPAMSEIYRLLTQPTFALFTAAAAFSLSSHAVYYAYGSVHWRSLGIGEGVIGALWAFSVAVEVAFMLALGPWLIARLGPVGALAVSGLGGILRWGAMMFDPPLSVLWLLQMLHTASFVAGHLGAIAFISAAVPERFGASAQGAFMGLAGGLLTALGMSLAAVVYPAFGGMTYGIAVVMSAAGLVLALRLGHRWNGRELPL